MMMRMMLSPIIAAVDDTTVTASPSPRTGTMSPI